MGWMDAPIVEDDESEFKWQSAPVVDEPDENLGAMPFVNKAIAETVGAPIDVLSSGLNLLPGVDIQKPIGGSESIKQGMRGIGIQVPKAGREASSLPEYIGEGIGETASFMLPVGGIVSKLSKTAGTTGRVASSIYNTMVKHPWLAGVSEVGGGVGTGTGRKVASETAPESPLARTSAEMAGGIAGSLAPTALLNTPSMIAIRGGKNLLKKISLPFTEKGAQYRAGKFVRGKVADPSKTIEKLSEETISELPPVVVSGEKRLQELYKGLIGKDPISDSESVEKIIKAMSVLESEMRGIGYGSPELLAELTQRRMASIELSMENRVVKAMGNAQSKIDALPVAKRQTDESRTVRTELENVAGQVRNDVRKLWMAVPKDMPSPVGATRAKYAELVAGLSQAEKVDIPPSLRNSFIVGDEDPVETTIKEMQGLRSKLLEVSRAARKDGKWNRARIADDMADAIIDDMSSTKSSDALSSALAGTRNYKNLFESGVVGKIRGFDKTGAPAIDPSLTLEISLGRSGAKGAVDINKVVITPEASEATKRYLSRSFTDYSLNTDGTLNPTKASRWVANNEDILDQFPALRTQVSDATEAQNFAAKTKAVMDARKKAIQDPRISTAARITNAIDLESEIGSILKSENSVRMVADLVRKANKDATGDAINGLRSGFVGHILEKSSIGSYNSVGEKTLSGRHILGFMKQNESALSKVFTPEQVSRIKRVGSELAKIETAEGLKSGSADINLEDTASSMIQLISRVSGAQVGRSIAKMTGGGTVQTPGIFSERFRAFTHGLNIHRANQMVIDAIVSDDPAQLKALLLPIDKPSVASKNLVEINDQMNAWLGGTGSRILEDISRADDDNVKRRPDESISDYVERTNQ